jgi:LysR family cys regulon transcriptional activator
MYYFIQKFAPHLTEDVVRQVQACSSRAEVDALFAGQVLPEM